MDQSNIEIGHIEMIVKADLGFGHKNPGILRGVELENKHDFDSFLAVTNCYKSF